MLIDFIKICIFLCIALNYSFSGDFLEPPQSEIPSFSEGFKLRDPHPSLFKSASDLESANETMP